MIKAFNADLTSTERNALRIGAEIGLASAGLVAIAALLGSLTTDPTVFNYKLMAFLVVGQLLFGPLTCAFTGLVIAQQSGASSDPAAHTESHPPVFTPPVYNTTVTSVEHRTQPPVVDSRHFI